MNYNTSIFINNAKIKLGIKSHIYHPIIDNSIMVVALTAHFSICPILLYKTQIN